MPGPVYILLVRTTSPYATVPSSMKQKGTMYAGRQACPLGAANTNRMKEPFLLSVVVVAVVWHSLQIVFNFFRLLLIDRLVCCFLSSFSSTCFKPTNTTITADSNPGDATEKLYRQFGGQVHQGEIDFSKSTLNAIGKVRPFFPCRFGLEGGAFS
jgi:hypothetical protein